LYSSNDANLRDTIVITLPDEQTECIPVENLQLTG